MAQKTNSDRLSNIRSFFTVLLGVFLALAGESWWSERNERRYERELREDMLVEFASNIEILRTDISANDIARAQFQDFVSLDESGLMALTDQYLTEQAIKGTNWEGFDPEMGSVQALVQSGNLGAIDDRELRLLLARWSGLLEQRRRFNLQAVDVLVTILEPFSVKAAADKKWTPEERHEYQGLQRLHMRLFSIALANQRQLLLTAIELERYLAGG